MALKIYSYPNNSRVYKALIAAKYNGVEIETPPFEFGKDNKTPEFLEKNPLGKVPVLDTPEGPIFESNAIARYVARLGHAKLYGNSAYEAGLIEQWIEFTRSVIELPASAWLYPIFGIVPNNVEATRKAKGDIRKALEILNKYLATRTFLVGERITLADIIVSMNLLNLYTTVLDSAFRKMFYNTNRWFVTLINQPEFKSVIGEVVLCEKMAVAPEPEYVREEEEEEEEKPKPKQKKQKQPKQPKQAPKKKEKEPEEEEEEEAESKPKAKNPLDLLPPSKMNMDEWKRVYSNTKDLDKAMEWFWEHYDPEGYSLWFADFKYNDECTQLFMTLNKLNGWMQRLEKLHKYAFGNLLVFGVEPKLEVSCCWLFRGSDVPQEMRESDDFSLYEWTKVDTNDEAQRKKVNEYCTWKGDFGGRVFNENGKCFK
jgi:elongation factor 1-gamma